MKVLITGATGFLGHAISRELLLRGHELVVISRDADRARAAFPQLSPAVGAAPRHAVEFESWDCVDSVLPATLLEGVGGIVHLAGEPVAAKRWTAQQKTKIRDSRVLGTRHLWQGIAHARALGKASELKVFVAGSAIGYYGDRGDEVLTEAASSGRGFLAKVCKLWEAEIFRPGFDEVRQVAVRTGMVLGRDAGALAKLLPIYRLGLGGPVGSGKQWVSWIHLEDLARIFAQALEDNTFRGPINGVAATSVTNTEFSATLGRVLHRPALLPVPALVLKLAIGEMASMILESQHVKPEKLLRSGFKFRFESLEPALRDLCARESKAPAQSYST